MRLARIGEVGQEIPALIDSRGVARSLVGIVGDIGETCLSPAGLEQIGQIAEETLPEINKPYRYGPCVSHVSQFICVGLNYADHVKEAGMEEPAEPVIFMKSPSAICGANDRIIMPPGATKVDWEVELGVVIGTKCSYVDELDAAQYIAGYCVVNDISERAFQLEGTGQWVKGKSADTFGPIGPWLVTKDEVPDVQSLEIWLEVNGKEVQRSNTDKMIFTVPFLVSYISRYMTLQPGDVISTGTPFGVGLGMKPEKYLRPGDRMKLGVAGLGEQAQTTINRSITTT